MRKEEIIISALHVNKLKPIGPNPQNLVEVVSISGQDCKYFLRFTPKDPCNVDRFFGLDTAVPPPTGGAVGRFQSVLLFAPVKEALSKGKVGAGEGCSCCCGTWSW